MKKTWVCEVEFPVFRMQWGKWMFILLHAIAWFLAFIADDLVVNMVGFQAEGQNF